MTLDEYGLRMRAKRLQQLDETHEAIHLLFVQRAMKAVKGTHYAVKDVDDIFDYKTREAELLGIVDTDYEKTVDTLLRIAENLKEYRQMQTAADATDDEQAAAVNEHAGESIEGD